MFSRRDVFVLIIVDTREAIKEFTEAIEEELRDLTSEGFLDATEEDDSEPNL